MSYYHRLFRPAPFKVWAAIPQHILLLGANGNSPAMIWAGPTNCQYCPLSSEVSLYAGYIWFASPPLGHTSGLQANVGCTQAFPSGYSTPNPQEELKGESRLAEVDITRPEVNHGMSKSYHLICSSLEWLIPWPSSRALARTLISRNPRFSYRNKKKKTSFMLAQKYSIPPNLYTFRMLIWMIKSRLLFSTVATHRHISPVVYEVWGAWSCPG